MQRFSPHRANRITEASSTLMPATQMRRAEIGFSSTKIQLPHADQVRLLSSITFFLIPFVLLLAYAVACAALSIIASALSVILLWLAGGYLYIRRRRLAPHFVSVLAALTMLICKWWLLLNRTHADRSRLSSSLDNCRDLDCDDHYEPWYSFAHSSWKYRILYVDRRGCQWWLPACVHLIPALSDRSWPSKVSQRNGHAVASLLDPYLYPSRDVLYIFSSVSLSCSTLCLHAPLSAWACACTHPPLCVCSFSLFIQQHT